MADGVAELVFVSVVLEADLSPASTLKSSLLSPPLPPPLVLGNGLSYSCWTDGCRFLSISPFAMFAKSINDFTISFGAFSLFMIPITRRMHWPLAVFTVLTNWLLGIFGLLWHICLPSISLASKSKIESRKNPRSEKSPRYEVSENNFRFNESTVPYWCSPLSFLNQCCCFLT